jgi:hypothetical protein
MSVGRSITVSISVTSCATFVKIAPISVAFCVNLQRLNRDIKRHKQTTERCSVRTLFSVAFELTLSIAAVSLALRRKQLYCANGLKTSNAQQRTQWRIFYQVLFVDQRSQTHGFCKSFGSLASAARIRCEVERKVHEQICTDLKSLVVQKKQRVLRDVLRIAKL